MRDVPATLEGKWRTKDYVGERRPYARVTVQHPHMRLYKYSLTSTFSTKTPPKDATADEIAQYTLPEVYDPKHGRKINQCYASFLTKIDARPREIPNVRSVSWSRSTDADVADCTITLLNTSPLPAGSAAPKNGDLDRPGWYTYSRGGSSFSKMWGHTPNEWFGLLVPDNIIRTYEGYGCDLTKPAELDKNLVQTGMWIISSVDMDTDGNMTLKCQDVGRILMDQIFIPPVVPAQFFDIGWEDWDDTIDEAGKRLNVKATECSNDTWIGAGHSVGGHKLQWAFDGNPNTYWLSIGNDKPSRRFAYEWVQCSVGKQTVKSVTITPRKTGYTAYVSVKIGGVWQGKSTINYHRDGIGHNGGNIKYVATAAMASEKPTTITFTKAFEKVEAVRVTFGNLQYFPNFGTYDYRAGIRDVAIMGAPAKKQFFTPGPAGSNPGRYSDYTDLVKLFLAWGGWFWPDQSTWRDSRPEGGNQSYHDLTPKKFDTAVLGKDVRGAIWGDLQNAGVAGIAKLEPSNFDKKSLMECIAYVKDILGFLFMVDETGGVQWRLPNVFNRGNWRTTMSKKPGYVRDMVTITENDFLVRLDATVDSKNVREGNYVGNITGKFGAFARGWNPNPTGIRRMGYWSDDNWANYKECARAAELISLRQLFTYRQDRIRIPGFPKIQIDDQIRVLERTTSEGYIHYVQGVSSTLDMVTGEYYYDLTTHWLGFDPESKWIFNQKTLRPFTQQYLTGVQAQNPVGGPSRVMDT